MKVEELRKIKNELLENDFSNITKLEMITHFDDMGTFERLPEAEQDRFIDYAYAFWLDLDSLEHTLYSYCEALDSSIMYIGIDIIKEFQNVPNYTYFYDLINEKALL